MNTHRFFEPESLGSLRNALEHLEQGFGNLGPAPGVPDNETGLEQVLHEVAERLRDNYPYFHPCYAGQMLKPPHPVARLAYTLALWINANNHALDGGRASSLMEKQAVADLARMFGWQTHLGHLCSGGTMANLEALWVAGELKPGKKIVGSSQAHYTHQRLSQVLKLDYEALPCDKLGRMDLSALARLLETEEVGTVVATIGTTATGSVDPLAEILELRKHHGFRVHADAAYGGYFILTRNVSPATARALESLAGADSIVIDPHKHGLQPYGCGCVLFRDPSVGRFYRHDSPYTYFSSNDLHLGEISLECSRPGAAAVALWATHQLLPLIAAGPFASLLEQSRAAAVGLYERLRADSRWLTAFAPELDIVVWLPKADRVTRASELARAVFQNAARQNLHLALATLPAEFFDLASAGMVRDSDRVTCLRSVLMKPDHLQYLGQMWRILDQVVGELAEKRPVDGTRATN